MAAIQVAGRALLRRSPGLLRRAAECGGGEPRGLQQLSSLRPRGLHSLLDGPSTAAGALAPSPLSSVATSRCIVPSSRYMSTSSSSQSTTLTRKELAVALMREPTFVVGDDHQEIKSCDELLDLLKVDAKIDERTKKQAVAEARATIGKKKKELALLLLKEEVEGVAGHGSHKEKVQEELIAAARWLRDSLLPEAQRRKIEDLEFKNTALGIRFWKLVDCGIMVMLATAGITAYYAVQ